ncbi:hypothetical protein QQS21_004764 [Conoideocrella luteorostrata]|uniref:Uncharacterized protein n=1 Tax=Conoideocrella luteorostrata TaxID=1105319 RepID=A0AAJ0CTR9_9HYPO|nr:hypothetical protein QQS21_004764 [Conoideocrella luteorostrata]
MAPHSNADMEERAIEPLAESPTTDSGSDWVGEEMTDSDVERWYSRTYKRGSKDPMKEPLTASWGVPISDADVEKLKAGLQSRSMDDKWDMLVEDPDEKGGLSIHIIRSWLQEECYILHIIPKPSNDNSGSAKVQSITWEGNKAGLQCDAEQAQKEAVMLCRGHLNCEFEALPQYPGWMFWDSNAYKKLDAE